MSISFTKLFLTTFKISAVTFGGGYTIVPILRDAFVNKYPLMDDEEMINLIAIAQSAPGAMAVNTSILIGYKAHKIKGALTTAFATVLPPLIIITAISFAYQLFATNPWIQAALIGMRGSITAVMAYAVFNMGRNVLQQKKRFGLIVMIGSFILGYFHFLPTALVILLSGFSGYAYFGLHRQIKGWW